MQRLLIAEHGFVARTGEHHGHTRTKELEIDSESEKTFHTPRSHRLFLLVLSKASVPFGSKDLHVVKQNVQEVAIKFIINIILT
jgi:hypothetical protein